jgi:hypothetical protein
VLRSHALGDVLIGLKELSFEHRALLVDILGDHMVAKSVTR